VNLRSMAWSLTQTEGDAGSDAITPQPPALATAPVLGLCWRSLLAPGPRNFSPSDFEAQSLGEVLSFMRLLWAVVHGLEATSKQMQREIGVTGPQRLVLRLVGHYVRLSPGDLAELMHVHPSSLTGVLRRLEQARLIGRKRDPGDGRRAILTLTAKGRSLNSRRARTVEDSVRRTLDASPATRTNAARELLSALADELDR